MSAQVAPIKDELSKGVAGRVEVLQIAPLSAVLRQPDGRSYTITAEIVMVTPEQAQAWLALEKMNRKSRQYRVSAYTRDMASGDWRVTNQGIAFDNEGNLIDGGHRLRSVIASGATVPMLIVRGLPPETQNQIDTGGLRTPADQLAMWTGSTRAQTRIAVVRILRLLSNGWRDQLELQTYEETCKLLEVHAVELDWVLEAFPHRHILTPTPVMAAWAFAYRGDRSVARWVEQYVDGTDLEKRDPLWVLRNAMSSGSRIRSSLTRRSMALRTLRALWAKINGEALSSLYENPTGAIAFLRLQGKSADAWTKANSHR